MLKGDWEEIRDRKGGRTGISEKLYSDTFPRVNTRVPIPCDVGYPKWPITLHPNDRLVKLWRYLCPTLRPKLLFLACGAKGNLDVMKKPR